MSKSTRREFLTKTILGAAGTGMALTVFRPEDLLAAPQVNRQGYVAGRYALELDGVMAGWLSSVEGGHATSDVVVEKIGPDRLQKKPIGGVKNEDITLACGTGMSRGFYEWIKAALANQNMRKNGAIITCDYDGNVKSRLEWNNALITEVGFPALDAASKDAAKMTIKFSPEVTRMQAKGGGKLAAGNEKMQQKKWLPSNFRLQIAALDCTRVEKIEAITVKQKGAGSAAGQVRNNQMEPAAVEIPNLVVTLPEPNAQGFYKWHEDFVIRGQQNSSLEKTGELHYLTPDLRETLFTLNFQHVGIFKVTPEKSQSGSDKIRRVRVEMYCEQIQFSYGPGSTWA